MPDDWATQFTKEALAKIDAFIAGHPGYTRQGVEQPRQGATNRVVFARRGDGVVVLKVFCEAERKERECFGLRHWRDTGLVPELMWDADPRMIVMSRVPGVHLGAAREVDGEVMWREAWRGMGTAVGSLTRVPLMPADRAAFESRFYEGLGAFEAYLGRILELGRSVHARDPDFRGGFWRKSLDFIDAQLDAILSQPRVLYHQDIGNSHVEHGCFMSFYDLEMCRVGCAAMQLGSSLAMLGEGPGAWAPFCEGWEAATNAPLGADDRKAAAAANHLLAWRRISRWLSYDGTPGSGYRWAGPANPGELRHSMQAVEDMIGVERR